MRFGTEGAGSFQVMTYLENIFDCLERAGARPVIEEVRDGRIVSTTGAELLTRVHEARGFLRARGLRAGDRCALLAPNSTRWAATNLALMAEGIIAVPLYARQAPAELAAMVGDSFPACVICSDQVLAAEVQRHLQAKVGIVLLEALFAGEGADPLPPWHHADSDPVVIIYTSGTSGEPKGAILNAGNVNHMLPSTNARLDQLMGTPEGPENPPDRIFHYGPFCFAASWILLLTALSRNSVLTLSTDLAKLSDELKLAAPDYFINVPIFLERVRRRIEETIDQRGRLASVVFRRARRAFLALRAGKSGIGDSLCLALASRVMFPPIRKSVGPNLRALICGSAPLSVETQLFFMMLGIPVLQVYGLTETTAICTLDDPRDIEPGRVGKAVPGTEMKLAENGEILVRGPNIFPGYWQRPAETAKALEGGWFHTGDQGEANAKGNWRITGRMKDLIILNSGHNVAPEPLEHELAERLPEAHQIVLIGNRRSSLAALVTRNSSPGVQPGAIQAAVEEVNAGLPHYKQIRSFEIIAEPFTPENGLVTAMGKLKREAIAARYAAVIERMYQKKPA
jgi:long-chain acyl-CoA synthetase